MRKHINKIIPIVVLATLVFSFICIYGENMLINTEGQFDAPSVVEKTVPIEKITQTEEISKNPIKEDEQANTVQATDKPTDIPTDIQANGDSLKQTDEQEIKEPASKSTCEVSVRCDTIFANLDKFKSEKHELLPDNGVIYYAENVEFAEGESAFDLLLREMRRNNIHIEFEYTTAFDSVYIEGIGNIYEFDCGQMSGWLYMVNGKLASCGSSQYILCPGDKVEWVYTCNFGADIGKNR
ncbi:MAG: DUF4430 domain-containing protein [Ruminococcaceae bacterium]|nr:DUF4430 domain-containing protein [Oscillospiraceae bacterium]